MSTVRLENPIVFAANWRKTSPYFIARERADKKRRRELLEHTPRGIQKERAKAARKRRLTTS